MIKFDTETYWMCHSEGYRSTIDTDYHRNRLAMIESLIPESELNQRVVDFGCGDGIYAERILRSGGTVTAIDINQTMTDATKDRLSSFDADKWSALRGGVDVLEKLADQSVDVLLALNVLAYLNAEENEWFYQQTHRVLAPRGLLIVTHSNELFDMYTFNRYTVAFYNKHFPLPQKGGIASLITYPDQPQRRDLPTRENPLSYRYKLAHYGFSELRQEFSILHRAPPLLTPEFDPDDLQARTCPNTLDWPENQRWKLMFMCSIFGSRAQKTN